MRIGVEVTMAHDLLHVDLDEKREELLSVDSGGPQTIDVCNLDAINVFHGEYPFSSVLRDDGGDDNIVAVGELGSYRFHRLRLVEHVHFQRHVGGKLLINGLERIVAEARLEPDERSQYAQVRFDEPGTLGIDNFNRDGPAILQLRFVDLRQGCGGDGNWIELREDLGDWGAQFALNVWLHLFPGMRRDLVLEARENARVFFGEDVRAASDRLTDLDHEAAKRHYTAVDALGAAAVVVAQPSLVLLRRHPLLPHGKHLVAGQNTGSDSGGVCKAEGSVLSKTWQHGHTPSRGSGAPLVIRRCSEGQNCDLHHNSSHVDILATSLLCEIAPPAGAVGSRSGGAPCRDLAGHRGRRRRGSGWRGSRPRCRRPSGRT